MAKNQKEEKELISSVVHGIDEKFGPGSAMTFDSLDLISSIKGWVPTGSTLLNLAIGHKGLPMGRITEITGQISTGKSALGAHILAETQKTGGLAVLLDTEWAWDKHFASLIGVREEDLITCQPENLTQCFEIIEACVEIAKAEAPDRLLTLLWDTFSATPTKEELEGGFGDSYVGIHARRASMAMRRLSKMIAEDRIALVVISQSKQVITSMPTFGPPPETSIGGRAIGFHASVRIQMNRIGKVRDKKKRVTGIKCIAKITKNKVAPPFREARFEIIYDRGIDEVGSLLDYIADEGIVKKKGGWFFYGEEKFQRSKWHEFYEEHPELKKQIEEL